jgi:pre-mRNA 3'-end-processing factor FIP1
MRPQSFRILAFQLPPGLGDDDDDDDEVQEVPGEDVAAEGGDDDDDEDEDSDEDDVQIDINQQQIVVAAASYQTFGLNKAVRQPPGAGEKKGKFAVEEFDAVGTITGKPAHEYDIESVEDKPWRKPGKKKTLCVRD